MLSVYDAQTEILRWIRSRGGRTDDPQADAVYKRWRMCLRKRRYDTKPRQKGYRAYVCPHCGGWHLTKDR